MATLEFKKNVWSSNDIITADELNRLENGVEYNNEGVSFRRHRQSAASMCTILQS